MEIENLNLQEKIGQMLMVGIDTSCTKNDIEKLITKYKVGGILLYKKNYKNYEQMLSLINYIKKLNKTNKVPIFIATDHEGGRVNRMPKEFENIPAAYKLARSGKEDTVKQAGEIMAKMLSSLGFNFNLAPVLDIKRFPDNHAIGDRAFSEDKNEVSKCGITYMKELQKRNIVSVIKHFPGHGSTSKDSHFSIPKIKNIQDLEAQDMKPFEEAIKNGADCLLVSHLKIKGITNKFPTSMSRKFITKYIRKKYRYNGIIITDDVRMRAVRNLYGKNKAVKIAFEAGNDIILLKHNKGVSIIDELIKSVERSKIKQARVGRSVKRILQIKSKYNINDEEIIYNENFVNEINSEIKKCII